MGEKTEGRKDTNPKDAIAGAKVPLWLLSPIAKAIWSIAMFAGMTKYGAWNWRVSGVRLSVYLSAIQRHFDAFVSGETHDPVDCTHHLGNIMACCAIILDAAAAGKLVDDRPPSVSLRPTYAEAEATMATLQAKYADKSPKHYTIDDTTGAPLNPTAAPRGMYAGMVPPEDVGRKGDWILVHPSGKAFWPLDPRPEDVELEDIAHHLSMLCRFNGGTRWFYSVAQHCCIVADNLPRHLAPQGLMHDSSEYVCGDVVRPVKRNIVGYDAVEDENARVIGLCFGLELVHLPREVKDADTRALFTEKRDLRNREPREDHAAPPGLAPYPNRIHPWTPAQAKAEFMRRAQQLGIRKVLV